MPILSSFKFLSSDSYEIKLIFESLKLLICWSQRLYILNNFKNYQGVNAINLKNENEFLQTLLIHCRTNKYFLFGCDSLKKVKELYTKCKNEAHEIDKAKYLLITAEDKFKIQDASKQFKNKYVFYSPSITFGVDFSISEHQDVFIYCKGTSILPSGVFQQTTRTRQINNLFYYCDTKSKQPNYNSIDEVYEYYSNIDNLNNTLNNICVSIDE